jgi:antirestriction protein ArdC
MKTTAKKENGLISNGKSSAKSKGWRSPKKSAKDLYQEVTDLILEKLEKGIIPWKQPWGDLGLPSNYLTKKPYRGINLWILLSQEHSTPYYLTFKQAQELGGKVKKGSKSIPICYWNFVYRHKETGERIPKDLIQYYPKDLVTKSSYLKEYKVFCISDIEGIEFEDIKTGKAGIPPIEQCEAIFDEMLHPPKIRIQGNEAYYHVREDCITIPEMARFERAESYYSVLFHELVHATGNESRLGRSGITEPTQFGTEAYSKEELIAEMGAGYLGGMTGILDEDLISNHTAYIQNWITVLKKDKGLLIEAASKAQKAVDYILMECPF